MDLWRSYLTCSYSANLCCMSRGTDATSQAVECFVFLQHPLLARSLHTGLEGGVRLLCKGWKENGEGITGQDITQRERDIIWVAYTRIDVEIRWSYSHIGAIMNNILYNQPPPPPRDLTVDWRAAIERLRLNSYRMEQPNWTAGIEQLGWNSSDETAVLNTWNWTSEIERLGLKGWNGNHEMAVLNRRIEQLC